MLLCYAGIQTSSSWLFWHVVCVCAQLKKIGELPPLDEMTLEMAYDYFPEIRQHEKVYQTMWPHCKWYQPENDPNTIP